MSGPSRPGSAVAGAWRLLALALIVGLSGVARGQGTELVIKNHEGDHFAFPDEDDPSRHVWVWIGGVEIQHGPRTVRGRSLVLVTPGIGDRREDTAKTNESGLVFSGDSVLEAFVDGDVVMEQGDEIVLGAQSLRLDNVTGEITILEGRWQGNLENSPLVVRFDVMRQLANGTHELEGVSYTTCEYDHAHWSVDTPWCRLVPTLEGRVLHTAGNTPHIGSLPVVWLPGFHMNVDRDRPPLRRIYIGTSGRFGTEISTTWGGDASEGLAAILGRPEKEVDAEWQFILANYSSRGLFTEPRLEYEVGSSRGEVFGSYIKDRNKADELGEPIVDDTRGRFDLEHRTKIDENRTVDIEVSYISDQGYLEEYYEDEFRTGKEQETYINYRDVEDNQAMQVLTRARLNDYETQAEYLPEFERRTAGDAVDTGVFGPAFFSSRSFVSNGRIAGADRTPPTIQPRSDRVLRGGNTGTLTWPVDVAEDRLRIRAGYDLTGFEEHIRTPNDPATPVDDQVNDQGAAFRYALTTGIDWSRTYSGVGDVQSDLWNFDGVRQIVEPTVGFASVLELNKEPEDLVLIDEVETDLAKQQLFFVGLRHRVQTHQRGDVATVFDTQLTMPIYTNEDRDNPGDPDPVTGELDDGRTLGLLNVDTVWKPGSDIWGLENSELRWRARIDPNNWEYQRSFMSYNSPFGPDRRIAFSHDRVVHQSNTLRAGMEWVLTPKWSVAMYTEKDLREDENARRGMILRQRAHRWLFDLEVTQRRGNSRVNRSDNRDDVRFSITIRPAVLQNSEQSLLDNLGTVRTR